MKFCLLFLICIASQAIASEEPTCSKGYEKSAVTPEATKDAEAARENPIIIDTEVYSSKVKSKHSRPLKETNPRQFRLDFVGFWVWVWFQSHTQFLK